jgi:LysW-gamma-L-alpha-aminoadipyl-6-phosphate/LysW-L-glutamyl-5-phosphate reductase
MKVAIAGGSGYTGGELLRLLLAHPEVDVAQVTSESRRGDYVHAAHPNLRGRSALRFSALDDLAPCDVLFLCLPHGEAMRRPGLLDLAPRTIDLSADFRLRDAASYERWYGAPHAAPDLLGRFVYGLPELHRETLRRASRVSGVGCLATATILALYPLVRAGVVRPDPIVVEAKVGSSAAGNTANPADHHPERAGVLRSFMPVGHRHTAEVEQELTFDATPALKDRTGALARPSGRVVQPTVHLSATAVEAVRGVLATAHAFLSAPLEERDLWRIYRECYGAEPFVRLVKERAGIYRLPEPKILAGSNYCDVGFALDAARGRAVTLAAIDNLMKGAAGTAVQCMNLMCSLPETLGLEFAGLHPV